VFASLSPVRSSLEPVPVMFSMSSSALSASAVATSPSFGLLSSVTLTSDERRL
jgi:hypothetical protein